MIGDINFEHIDWSTTNLLTLSKQKYWIFLFRTLSKGPLQREKRKLFTCRVNKQSQNQKQLVPESFLWKLNNASSGNGPGNILDKLLKCLANELLPHVTVLFNHILRTDIFRKQWKHTYVTPVCKKRNRNCLSYRPISSFSKVSVVLKRLVFYKLCHFVKKAKSSQQFDFMKRKSTTLQFLDFLTDAYRCNDNKVIINTLNVDFAKAIDKISQAYLLEKLHRFGVCGDLLQSFRSYLSERYQCVNIHCLLSLALPITSDVP